MLRPGPYHCPEFGGKNFFPPQGWGWATDSPGADCRLMRAIHRLTGQHVYPNPNYMEIMDPDLFFLTSTRSSRLRMQDKAAVAGERGNNRTTRSLEFMEYLMKKDA